MLSTRDIRQKFIAFFESKQHQGVKSSSLIPGNDPTLLFVNAGMVQFKDVFLGAEKRAYTRATSSQRCVRAGGKHNDLDQVGYTARHHTFFEMLGNFSFGDYFKREAIQYAWEFLVDELKLPVDRLWVTVFEKDDEAERIWRDEIGFPADRISRIGAKDNFWQMGDTGPCGPCTEIFYDHGADILGGPPGTPEEDGDRYIEIWNLVFMQYDKQPNGDLLPLPDPCVDTGMGLERIASILQGKHNNYDIDLFQVLIRKAAELTGADDLNDPSLKVIADHIRTCAFLIADGVLPSNEGRGYVLRRIIRRAARHGHKLGAKDLFFYAMVDALIEQMGEDYPELVKQRDAIITALKNEEKKFAETLDVGMQEYQKAVRGLGQGQAVPGSVAFKLYDTFGFPVDLTQDVAREDGRQVDLDGFDHAMAAQKEQSKANKKFIQSNQVSAELVQGLEPTIFLGYDEFAASGTVAAILKEGQSVEHAGAGDEVVVVLNRTPFYAESGGQVGDIGEFRDGDFVARVIDTQKAAGQYHMHHASIESGVLQTSQSVDAVVDQAHRKAVVLNHSATHLLHKVLRDTLGTHVQQKGSLVNADKLRFDFSHDQPVKAETLQVIESAVNAAIRLNYEAQAEEMGFDDAVNAGALALFGEKYGDEVRVMDFGGYSVELCGGTHVRATGDIGLFKITLETSVASGIRRIEAVTGDAAVKLSQEQQSTLSQLSSKLRVKEEQLLVQVDALLAQSKKLQKELDDIKRQQQGDSMGAVLSSAKEVDGIFYASHVFEQGEMSAMRDAIDGFKEQRPDGLIILGNVNADKAQVLVGVGKSLMQQVKAGDVVKQVLAEIGGRGGGRPDFAQGGGNANVQRLQQAIDKILQITQANISK